MTLNLTMEINNTKIFFQQQKKKNILPSSIRIITTTLVLEGLVA